MDGPRNVFSVDVEDWFQVSAFEDRFPPDGWDAVPPRLEIGLRRLLDLTASSGVRGTFYVLGWIAVRRPDLVRAIREAGHELGCHSFQHRLVYRMDPGEFRRDTRQALDAIRQAAGEDVVLYRAPSWSITPRSLWALEILAGEGIRIDSSIFPVAHDRYGFSGAPRGPYHPLPGHREFVEFPPSTVKVLGAVLPCAGGGYLRLSPLAGTRAAIRRINRVEGRPAVVYVHPWELDPEQPRVAAGALRVFRHRVGLARTEARLRSLFATFAFGPITEVLAETTARGPLPVLPLA